MENSLWKPEGEMDQLGRKVRNSKVLVRHPEETRSER